ncbi:ABC transporter permease [Glaciihabitans sp. UYNi722]|uniref:ABC transporter permease n=1 Tax=Glaciihabitans sp. UYNi722 TaxID=3156344 RepID=UPI003394BCFB
MTTVPLAPEIVGEGTVELEQAIAASWVKTTKERRHRSLLVRVLQVASVLAFLSLWELFAALGALNPLFFSRPSAIGAFVVTNWTSLWSDTLVTLSATLIGFAIGSIAGTAAAFAISSISLLDRVLQPWISVLMSIPRVALAPLFLLWFGITQTSKIALAISIVFFMVLVTTASGMKTVSPDLISLTSAFHASPWQRFRTVLVPWCVPAIMAGLRLGVVTAVLGVVSSEIVASSSGLGQKIVLYGQNFNSAGVFAVLALLAIITTAMNAIIAWAEYLLLRWQRA